MVIGFALLGGAGFLYNEINDLRGHALHAPGVVVELEMGSGSSVYHPVVEFRKQDGSVHTFTSDYGSYPPAYAQGEKVEVLYDPADPKRAEINDHSLWLPVMIVGGLGALFSLIGFGGTIAMRGELRRGSGPGMSSLGTWRFVMPASSLRKNIPMKASAARSGKATYWVLPVFAVIGLLLWGIAVYSYLDTRAFIATAQTAPGKVVEVIKEERWERKKDSGGHMRDVRSVYYYPKVEFAPAGGGPIRFKSRSGSNPAAYEVGEAVEVLYHPANPADARINHFFELWGIVAILGVIGSFFAGPGVVIGIVRLARRRAAKRLEQHGVDVQAILVEKGAGFLEGAGQTGSSPLPRDKLVKALGYEIRAQWIDPMTGQQYEFTQHINDIDPDEFANRRSVTVRIDPENPKHYRMDLSMIPKMVGG